MIKQKCWWFACWSRILLAKIEYSLLGYNINVCGILKCGCMWVCRSLSVENARWPKASVNLAHKVDEWIDELTIAPENAGDVLDYIISRKKVNAIAVKWQGVDPKPAKVVTIFFAFDYIDAKAYVSLERVAPATAAAEVNRCGFHWDL